MRRSQFCACVSPAETSIGDRRQPHLESVRPKKKKVTLGVLGATERGRSCRDNRARSILRANAAETLCGGRRRRRGRPAASPRPRTPPASVTRSAECSRRPAPADSRSGACAKTQWKPLGHVFSPVKYFSLFSLQDTLDFVNKVTNNHIKFIFLDTIFVLFPKISLVSKKF